MNRILKTYFAIFALSVLVGCSTTSNIPDDDQLFIGLKKINYENY